MPEILKVYFRLKQTKYSHHLMSEKVDVLSENCAKKLMLSYEVCFSSVDPQLLFQMLLKILLFGF